MSSRDEDRIKEKLKSVRPEYDKTALWQEIEAKLPEPTEKRRGGAMWIYLVVGLIAGVGLTYAGMSAYEVEDSVENIEGSGAQKVITTTEDLVQEQAGTYDRIDTDEDGASSSFKSQEVISDAGGSVKDREQGVLPTGAVVAERQSLADRESVGISSGPYYTPNADLAGNGIDSKNMIVSRSEEVGRVASESVQIGYQGMSVQAQGSNLIQVTADEESVSLSKNAGLLSEATLTINGNSALVTTLPIPYALGILPIQQSASSIPFGIDFDAMVVPVREPLKSTIIAKQFISVQTSSSLVFPEAGYNSDSAEWKELMRNSVRPIWNQDLQISYERALGSGWFALGGIRAAMFTERLEVEVVNEHQPEMHYSDTAFYYQFSSGLLSYYGGNTTSQDVEVRRVGQYNQSLSIGAHLGAKYVKTWSRWGVAPSLSVYAMPYTFTSGKSISSDTKIIDRRGLYQAFYGIQGQLAAEYRLTRRTRIFGGVNYQADLSNRLMDNRQSISVWGLSLGTRLAL